MLGRLSSAQLGEARLYLGRGLSLSQLARLGLSLFSLARSPAQSSEARLGLAQLGPTLKNDSLALSLVLQGLMARSTCDSRESWKLPDKNMRVPFFFFFFFIFFLVLL